MQTKDGYTITYIEQEGDYAGEDVGKLWIHYKNTWAWYGGFINEERREEVCKEAQQRTFLEFDIWFDEAL